MKRCRGCGRGIEGVGEWCGGPKCEATRRRQCAELALPDDVLLKEDLLGYVAPPGYGYSPFWSAIRLAIATVPYDNAFGLLELDDKQLREFGDVLPRCLADKLLASCTAFEDRKKTAAAVGMPLVLPPARELEWSNQHDDPVDAFAYAMDVLRLPRPPSKRFIF